MHHSSPMNMGTQAESASQSYEETQIESDTFMDHQLGLDRLTEEDEEEEDEPHSPKPWARLVSLSSSVPHQDLFLEHEGTGDGVQQFGLYTLGRGSKCDFVFKQKLISNVHSKLYCLKDATTSSQNGNGYHKMCPYIEDNSANGTYVNKSTRLKKGVRRVLHDGDLVSLVNPDTQRPGGAATPSDVEAASFFVHIFLPTEQPARSMQHRNMIASILGAGGGAGADNASLHNMRSATVTHLLGQERSIFDYYDQKELLGSGANGQVYRCIHKVDGHECAVKATNIRSSSGGGLEQPSLERVLMEAHMIRALKHPNIIQLEDVFSDQNTLFLVMELVRGGDLFDRIVARGRYAEEAAKVVMQQTLSAMKFMHDKNVAHRDMKPENILLLSRDSDLDIKITDFGLAKSSDDSGGLKTFCGTPHYFAPEVQNQQPAEGSSDQQLTTYGFEADMWSIGVIAYVLLSGDYPWSGDSGLMCQEIAAGKVNFNKNKEVWQSLSPAAVDFISQLIVLDPRARLTAEQALQHPWLDSVQPSRSSKGPNSNDMPPPTTTQTTTRHSKGKKRAIDDVDLSSVRPNPDITTTGAQKQQRCSRSRVAPANTNTGNTDSGHAPMEISLTGGANARTRLPRKAKQSSIGQYCQKNKL